VLASPPYPLYDHRGPRWAWGTSISPRNDDALPVVPCAIGPQSSHRVSVTGCVFEDLSGGSVKFGSVDPSYASSSDPADWDAYLSATGNVASNMAVEYGGAAGLFGGCVVPPGMLCAWRGGGAGGRY
jgi:hypothetical protein